MGTVNDMTAELNFRSRKSVTFAFDGGPGSGPQPGGAKKESNDALENKINQAAGNISHMAKELHGGNKHKALEEYMKRSSFGPATVAKLKSRLGIDGTLIATDPLTSKGNEIKSAMEKQYGPKKGEQVFYASRNAGKITGVDDAESAKDSKGRWGGRARDAMNMDAWTNSILDKFEKEKEDAHEMAPKKVEDTVKEPERVAKDDSYNPNNLKAETPAQRRHDEANLVKDGRWGGRISPHAKDGGPGSGPKSGGSKGASEKDEHPQSKPEPLFKPSKLEKISNFILGMPWN